MTSFLDIALLRAFQRQQPLQAWLIGAGITGLRIKQVRPRNDTQTVRLRGQIDRER
jgi:hypothetical protein